MPGQALAYITIAAAAVLILADWWSRDHWN